MFNEQVYIITGIWPDNVLIVKCLWLKKVEATYIRIMEYFLKYLTENSRLREVIPQSGIKSHADVSYEISALFSDS